MNTSTQTDLPSPRSDPFDISASSAAGFSRNILRLWQWMHPYRLRIAIALLFALLTAAAAVLMPVVFSRVVIDDILMRSYPLNAPDFGQKALTAWFSDLSGSEPLFAACSLYLFWMLLRVVFGYAFDILFSSAMQAGLNDLRRELFAHVEYLPASFYDRVRVGQVLTRITSDIESLSELLSSAGGIVAELIPFGVALSVMLSLDATLTAEVSPFLLLVALVTMGFRWLSGPIYQRIRETHSRLNEHLHENLSGIEVVQLYQREALNAERFAGLVGGNRHEESRAINIETAYYPIIENITYPAVACILWLGSQHVQQHTATLGSIVLFLQFSDMLFRPVVMVGYQASIIFRAVVACDRIFRLLDWKETLAVPPQPTPLPADLHGRIEFKNLNFSYETSAEVIRNFSLAIRPGENIAIIGATGSGKTTLTRLICRFYDVPPDSLFIDGIDIMQIAPAEIRQRIGVILQDFHLFPGTIYDNIALGNPTVTPEAARHAAKLVQALEFIEALPLGFDTVLEDRGNNLSQGQRQLLAFARVIALDPEILILDEATASIDPTTEAAIQAALSRITANRTTIVIAHRLQTIRNANRIVVLDRGELAEIGRHYDLLSRNGLYKTLYDAQFDNDSAYVH